MAILLRGLAALMLLAGSAAAQTPPARPGTAPATPAQAPAGPARPGTPPAAPERAWRMTCADAVPDQPRDCRVVTAILLRPQNQRLAQVVLSRQRESQSLTILFQLPHGAFLPAGMAWQVDESEAQRLPFQTSDAEGLYAGQPVTDDVLAALRRGTNLRLTFIVAARRETIVVPVPLAQFSDAVGEMFTAERARR